jgi:hypothetical protein
MLHSNPKLSFSTMGSISGIWICQRKCLLFVPTKSDDWEAEIKNLNRSVQKICCFCNHKARIGKQRFKDLNLSREKLLFSYPTKRCWGSRERIWICQEKLLFLYPQSEDWEAEIQGSDSVKTQENCCSIVTIKVMIGPKQLERIWICQV